MFVLIKTHTGCSRIMAAKVSFEETKDTDYSAINNTTISNTQTQASPFERTGAHRAIYELKKNPKASDKDYLALLTKDDEKLFPFESGTSYQGEWLATQKHGIGIEHLLNNLIYEGEYQYDKRHGTGILYKNEETKSKLSARKAGKEIKRKVYDGQWADGMKDGQGNYYYKNADLYVGEWKEDKRSGRGILYISSTEDIYEGNWLNGLQEGRCF